MPEATQLQFDHAELTRLMLRSAGITEGHWQMMVVFACMATNTSFGDAPMMPTQMVGIQSIGLMKVTEPTPLSVDAAAEEWSKEIEV